ERQAKEPPAKVIPILERAVKSNPGFTEAKIELGMMQIDARNFSGAVSVLMSIPDIRPQQATLVFCGLAYADVQTGDLDNARKYADDCRKWAKTDADQRRAAPVLKFVEARSNPSADVRPGEKLQRVAGVARALECSPEGSRLQVVVGNKVAAFDFPEAAAVEMPAAPRTNFVLKCGPLNPVRIGVEFAPPRSAIETSMGIVRRLDY
ncbi:MAG TPA: hypothetical protein VHC72_02535, partial [Bryobacteraceae bacterium]|nr:hypothetical protein [Bryobacteraceae bacterium]